jgi:protein-disulfide isomerase
MEKIEMPAIFLRVVMIALLVPFMAAAAVADVPTASDETVAQKATALLSDPSSPVIGNPHADVAVVEFFDYACPYCKAVEPRLEAMLRSDHGTKLVLKEFPILTPESMIATKAALASVKQGRYAQFHEALMAYKGPLQDSVIFDTAKNVGLDVSRLRKDMAAPEITDEIIANFNLARSQHIFQTPGFIVGNHILTGPSADIDFPKAVAAARAK